MDSSQQISSDSSGVSRDNQIDPDLGYYEWPGRKLVFDKVELDAYINSLEGGSAEEAVARILHHGTIR